MSLSPGWRRALFCAATSILAVAPGCACAQDKVAPPPPATASTVSPTPSAASGQLDPQSPLAPMPDLGVAWPDLSSLPAEPVDPNATPEMAGEVRYDYRVDGIEEVATPLLRERFKQLSTLAANDGKPANAAQLDRRAREDAVLLVGLLRAQGYYDARVTSRLEPRQGRPLVVLEAEPGTVYKFDSVTLAGLSGAGDKAPGLETAFGVKPGAPVDADAIAAGEAQLRTKIGNEGFPFAKVDSPQIVVDHATHTATLDMAVAPGGAKRFGKITSNPNNRVFGAKHIQEIARFKPGQPYDAESLADLRRALIQTSLVSTVDIKPVDAGNGLVDIDVTLERAPPRTIAGELGYGTGEGARIEVDWTHRNLFPPEGALTLRGVVGTKEQLVGATFRRNNFHGRDRILTGQFVVSNLVRDAYRAKTISLSGSLERQTTIFFQKKWVWSLGAEIVASDERDTILATGAPRKQIYYVGALPTSLSYDGSNDLLDPSRGFRLSGRFSPEVSFEGKAFGYARVQFDASAYRSVTDRVVVAGRVRFGTIAGAPRDAIAPSRRFYAGGGGSVRGFGYQDIGPKDPNGDPVGGRSLTEFSLEARVKAFGNFGIVPFIDGGNIYTTPLPSFTGLRYGAGLGVRYYSNFGPIRLDVGTPINRRPGEPRIAVYVSLGQAF
ncbi:BamA/TamA family outer membrane protein [Sphingomonas sp. AR_OL41]|uniref:BamA/TamA family outer membrane protein n=1 Tax=Sphingomonas sp. AR_OL41 TaxID=3042729 RepID=UPI0024807E28|nr:BamA/TamA family outer membrane protein [Sphingomonas sp. AR_OL41]MDH7973582.1 BamA/TamA family outer membrane protein [Sphingomonas sp. AR_OL41]